MIKLTVSSEVHAFEVSIFRYHSGTSEGRNHITQQNIGIRIVVASEYDNIRARCPTILVNRTMHIALTCAEVKYATVAIRAMNYATN
jgi:hypothetical protein